MVSLTQIWLRKNGVDTHGAHHPTHLFAVNLKAVIPPQNPRDSAIPPCRIGSMELVDPSHYMQIFSTNGFRASLAINAGAVNP